MDSSGGRAVVRRTGPDTSCSHGSLQTARSVTARSFAELATEVFVPFYTYSLAQGIAYGFLAPYRVHRIVTDYDAIGWRPTIGELDRFGREIPDDEYQTPDFERAVALRARTEAIARHLATFLKQTDRFAKTIVFFVDQEHASEMRHALINFNADLVAQNPDYVCRVTADEGDIGKGKLSAFQDVERAVPVATPIVACWAGNRDKPPVLEMGPVFKASGTERHQLGGVERLSEAIKAVSRGVLLLLLVASVRFAPAAPVTEAPRDLKQHLAFSEVILEEVEAHQYDLLETQYQQFKMPGELLPDGIEKLWIYFAAFYGRFQSIRTEEEGDAFVQSVRAWFTERPGSVAALLCLENALVGQLDWFWGRLREEKGGPGSAETVAKMDAIGEEYRRNFRDFPEAARAKVLAEPYYYTVALQFMGSANAPGAMVEELARDAEHVDPFQVAFCGSYVVWLFKHREKDLSLPRPEVWLTDRFKITSLDSENLQARKARAYAETVAFHGGEGFGFDAALLDWPTLKMGLEGLVKEFGAETDWPSRYLSLAFFFKDQTAARDALAVIGGNYSPEVIGRPDAFQEMSAWAEKPDQ